MLTLPNTGISTSATKHNCRLDVLADWIESSALLLGESFSRTDFLDHLLEEEVYRDQDRGQYWISDVWSEVQRRQRSLGDGSPFSLTATRIAPTRAWQEVPGYAFCLALSAAVFYNEAFPGVAPDYPLQGSLFELLTKASLEVQYPGWTVEHSGWSPDTPTNLSDVVERVANALGEAIGDVARWANPNANEAGLDLFCYRPYADRGVGVPLYLVQCASGKLNHGKLKEPDLDMWGHLVDFTASPRRAHATPLAFTEEDFIKNCGRVNGLLLDRYRLLEPLNDGATWMSDELTDELNNWSGPRITSMRVVSHLA